MLPAYFDTLRTLSQPIRSSRSAADARTDAPPARRARQSAAEFSLDCRHRLDGQRDNLPESRLQIAGVGQKSRPLHQPASASVPRTLRRLDHPPHRWAQRDDPASPRIITQSEFVEIAQIVFAAQQPSITATAPSRARPLSRCCWFAQQHIDTAVLEIGIGGRFDAVNAVANEPRRLHAN